MTEKQKLRYITDQLFPSKVYSYDILYDLDWIIRRLELFKHTVDEFEKERAEEDLWEISEITKKPRLKYDYSSRVYIISGVQFVGLACVALSETATENILDDLSISFSLEDPFPVETTDPNLVNTIYMFHKNKIYYEHMYPSNAMMILQALSSKNIVDYGLRKRWTVKD